MAFDEGRVYSNYGGGDDMLGGDDGGRRDPGRVVRSFKEFVKTHFVHDRRETEDPLLYRQALNKDPTSLLVDLVHVRMHDPALGAELEAKPAELLPLFERACKEVLREDHQLTAEGEHKEFADVQVLLFSSEAFGPGSVRDLSSERVMKLVQLPGIVTSAAKPKHKATYIKVQCKDCRNVETVACRPGLGGALIPKQCSAQAGGAGPNPKCSYNSFVVLGDRCSFVDQQTLKLQERPEDVPTGELPRTLLMVADRHLVSRVSPGTRVRVTGIYCTHRSQAMEKGSSFSLQQPYLRVVGLQEESDARKDEAFSTEEIAAFERLASETDVYDRHIFPRIAPQIFGSGDIKQAIACLLFGGSRKVMPDGTSRRGDINVLLLGDPSTAKSQFLKFVDKVAPICVYTSGKGSSAAGLTAAVVQEASSREFYLEGGAMVLADGGVVCIDEFDKMRPEDRVAIHEAMEQQTISIAKAGITTVLKSRTSVLAAANPPSGRYDDLASTSENIDLQSTILSRFDLIFIVRDVADADRDAQIAQFVLKVHANSTAAAADDNSAEEERFFKRYIHYCRTHCFPRLSDAAREALVSKYVDIRERARGRGRDQDTEESPIPITVRQLEALIRISESLARMALKAEAGPEQVERAYQLFYKSTINAMNAGLADVDLGESQLAATHAVEERIRDRLPLNGHLGFRKLMDDLTALGCSPQAVGLAVKVMLAKGELKKKNEGKLLQRVR